jgi:hypothetical protein
MSQTEEGKREEEIELILLMPFHCPPKRDHLIKRKRSGTGRPRPINTGSGGRGQKPKEFGEGQGCQGMHMKYSLFTADDTRINIIYITVATK